jgi:alkanesulfonate monooxygenase SsuD/methylene tetrahydromethanopterin reductase-like flavin-dependent oxidoreductase (luciferase family)
MKFSLAINLERVTPELNMREVVAHTLEMVQMADESGFGIVWIGEHHAIEQNISPAPFQILAFIAARTSRVRLGTAVVVAPYWHPVKLAGEAALFDLLSEGRLEFGIGRGAYQREFDIMVGNNTPQQEGSAYMHEMLVALKALWQGDYQHDGKYWSFPRATSVPKPLQKPFPPIWIAARDQGTYDWAISNGCNIQSWAIARPFSEVELYKHRFEDALTRYPLPARPKFLTMRWTAVYDTPDGWDIPVKAILRRSAQFENLFKNLGGVSNGFPDRIDLQSVENRAEYQPQALCENLLFGTPGEVIRKLRQYEALGVDDFCYNTSYGLPLDFQKKSLRRFIDEVIPAFEPARPVRAVAGS